MAAADDTTDPVIFAERVLALLDSGSFTMSYKYAVLVALIDCCVERLSSTGTPPTHLHARHVSDKVLELYWRQAVPYPNVEKTRVLRQRPELNKLDLVARIAELRREVGFDRTMRQAAAADPDGFAALRQRVHETVVRMPLPKLQRMNADDPFGDGFIYRIGWPDQVSPARVRRSDFDDRIHFQPGAAHMLLRVAGILRPIIERQWAEFVARRNADILDDLTLDSFLFGADRISLERVRRPLVDLQGGRCFYCDDRLGMRADVDHFLPWSRSNDDGLDNLVAAHARCNNAKRASLAAEVHVGRWLSRSRQRADDLATIERSTSWPRDAERTHAVARALYLYQAPGIDLWVAPNDYQRANITTLRSLLVKRPEQALAAEGSGAYQPAGDGPTGADTSA